MAEKDMPMRPVTHIKQRVCLQCQKKFKSTGPGNRICLTCRNRQPVMGKCEQACSGKRLNGIELAG